MQDSAAPPLPFYHVIAMTIGWISNVLYIFVVILILKKRKHNKALRTDFFSIFLFQSICEIICFLNIELIARPRKFRFFSFFTEQTPDWFLKFGFFMVIFLRSAMYLGHIPMAINRFTSIVCWRAHTKIWAGNTVLFCFILIWSVSIIISLSSIVSGLELHALLLSNGVLQMVGPLMKIFHKSNKVEIRLIIYAVITFVPMLLDAIFCFVKLLLPNNLEIIFIGGETWFMMSDISSSIQIWSIICFSKALRSVLFTQLGSQESSVVALRSQKNTVH